jgi:hypothetical protein
VPWRERLNTQPACPPFSPLANPQGAAQEEKRKKTHSSVRLARAAGTGARIDYSLAASIPAANQQTKNNV